MAIRFLRFAELKELKGIGFSRMHLDRLEREGKFPKRTYLSANTVVWLEEEIDSYALEKLADRQAEKASRSRRGSDATTPEFATAA